MLNIRRARLEDAEKVLDMLSRVWEDDYVKGLWAEWVQSPHLGIVLVAEVKGDMAGTCYINFMPHSACWFQAMRVDPRFRRLGVGSRLTAASLNAAREAGQTHVYLGIDADNEASLIMTAKAGFTKLFDYMRLTTKLPPRDTGEPRPTTQWRQAVEQDASAALALAIDHTVDKALYACWQWQPLSLEAIMHNIQRNNLWVWGQPDIRVWGGLEQFGPYNALFSLYGKEQDVVEAFDDLVSYLPRGEEVTLEVWLHKENPLYKHARSLGYEEVDGNTIWEYKL